MATPIPPNRATFTLEEIVRATRGAIAAGSDATAPAVGVVSDSRAVTPGSVFVALRGGTHDGHAFAGAAAARGAQVLVVERGIDVAGRTGRAAVVVVPDTLVAWGDLARAHLERWRARRGRAGRVVAITGSAGKTTTKELTAALLAEVGPTHFTAGNLNNRVGVPAVVFALEERHRFCVLEMGMSLPGEIAAITAFARPDVSLIVNVGVAHAEGVGGREGVMREKGAVYQALEPDGVAIVNADDDWVLRAANGTRAGRILTFGRTHASGASSYRLLERTPEGAGSRVRMACGGRAVEVHLPLAGEAAAIDLVAAIAAEEATSGEPLAPEAIERALRSVRLSGRGALLELGDVTVLDDSYNANPSSMRAALATLAELAGMRRRVVVLGEMKELGAVAVQEHEQLGDVLADTGVRLAIGCGGLIDRALDRAAERGVDVVRARGTADAARAAVERVAPGDVVLVKGSRSVGTERVVEALRGRGTPAAG